MSNYFEMFDLPQTFYIDEQALQDHYRKLQLVLHPDRYANASDSERRIAAEKSSEVNQAYSILTNPPLRAQYLLETQGVDCQQDEQTMSDPEFLMDMLETEDALKQACQQAQSAEAQKLLSSIASRSGEIEDQFSKAWQEQDFEQALNLMLKMKFLSKIYQRNQALVKALVKVGGER